MAKPLTEHEKSIAKVKEQIRQGDANYRRLLRDEGTRTYPPKERPVKRKPLTDAQKLRKMRIQPVYDNTEDLKRKKRNAKIKISV